MFDADKIIRILQSELPKGLDAIKAEGSVLIDKAKNDRETAVGAAAVGALGALFLSGSMGKFGKKLATMGSLAALGAFAYNAYKKRNPNISEQSFLPAEQKETLGKAIIRAIVNAIKADGIIDETERKLLFERMSKENLSDEEKAFLFQELDKPLDTDAVIKDATSPELAARIYAASFVAINPEGAAEKAYLADLANRLNIESEVLEDLKNEI